jgi:hypothetical protein
MELAIAACTFDNKTLVGNEMIFQQVYINPYEKTR